MKVVWKKSKSGAEKRPRLQQIPPLFDDDEEDEEKNKKSKNDDDPHNLVDSFSSQGNRLAEAGRYHEALGKWEAALNLAPENAELHEQKAQVLLETGDTWKALKAATRATELEPSWSEAWVTLGRAQLNFGEPDLAIKSFDKALEIKPDHEDAQSDRQTAIRLVKKRKEMSSSSPSIVDARYKVQ